MHKWLTACLITTLLTLPVSAQTQTVETAPAVDLKLYSGTWYEIASFPTVFQDRDCAGTSATYTLNPDGTVKVWNQCYVPAANGYRLERIEGRARVVEPVSNARLKVGFFGGFEGDYWILAHGEAYQWSLVGAPNRRFLWVLSRDPVMPASTYQAIVAEARRQGFRVEDLRLTPTREQGLSPQTARDSAMVK